MEKLRASSGLLALSLLAILPAISPASTVTLRRNSVIPVTFEDKLSLTVNKAGDMFTVRVTDFSPLPAGTELLGKIDKIHPANGNHPGSMDLTFTRILLPDNSRVLLDAAPIPLNNKFIVRGPDGRLFAKDDIRKQQTDVIGGAIGGFVIGSLLHRRVAGTIIGTMVGIVAAENDRKNSEVIANSGDKVGALINKDVVIDFVDPNLRQGGNDGPLRGDLSGNVVDRLSNITIRFKKIDLLFVGDARPYFIGPTVMVPLESAAKQLGLEVDKRKDRTIYVDGKDAHARLTEYSRQAKMNDDQITLPRTVTEHDGVV